MNRFSCIIGFVLAFSGATVVHAQNDPGKIAIHPLPERSQTFDVYDGRDIALGATETFEERTLSYTGGEFHDHPFRYRLFVPVIEPGKKYPIILWLHGLGPVELTNDNIGQLFYTEYLFMKGDQKSQYPFFVLIPQCPEGNASWYARRNKDEQMATISLAMLDAVAKEYPVDTSRVSLFGISGGATACWRMLAEHPDRFASAVLSGAAGCEPAYLGAIPKNIPIWAFHFAEDGSVDVKRARETVETLAAKGANTHLTTFPGRSHRAWIVALRNYDVLDWMLLQKHGTICWYPPGMPHWPQWKLAFLYGWFSCTILPILFLAACYALRYDRIRQLRNTRANISMLYDKQEPLSC